jgi:hypothetical protein
MYIYRLRAECRTEYDVCKIRWFLYKREMDTLELHVWRYPVCLVSLVLTSSLSLWTCPSVRMQSDTQSRSRMLCRTFLNDSIAISRRGLQKGTEREVGAIVYAWVPRALLALRYIEILSNQFQLNFLFHSFFGMKLQLCMKLLCRR